MDSLHYGWDCLGCSKGASEAVLSYAKASGDALHHHRRTRPRHSVAVMDGDRVLMVFRSMRPGETAMQAVERTGLTRSAKQAGF